MGEDVAARVFSREDRQRYRQKVRRCLDVFALMLDDFVFFVKGDAAWKTAAGGLTGVAVFWVLVVLPRVDSDRGFVLTAAMAALGAALWIAPSRSRSRG
mgnify:CR=1 FL=1